jgi:hypothetical protein
MRASPIVASLALAAGTAVTAAPTPTDLWSRVFLTYAADNYGAVCLDGSPPAYYIHWGSGADINKWIFHLQGGGWCTDLADCYGRSKTSLGSSKSYPSVANQSGYDFLNINPAVNPDFYTWTSVFLNYCDGASYSGNADQPAVYNNTNLFFRGFRILDAVIDSITKGSPVPLPSGGAGPLLTNATDMILTGTSAGGLGVYLHADYIGSLIPPTINFRAMSQVGFFINAVSAQGYSSFSDIYMNIATMQNSTAGLPQQVNEGCMLTRPPAYQWQCFFAQFTYPHIRTPIFVQNSKMDNWQLSNILSEANVPCCAQVEDPAMVACVNDPSKQCNSTQFASFTGYSAQFMAALNASVAASPNSFQSNGGLITSCDLHDHMLDNGWNRIKVNGQSMRQILTPWLLGNVKSSWTFDVEWPNNPTCEGPL